MIFLLFHSTKFQDSMATARFVGDSEQSLGGNLHMVVATNSREMVAEEWLKHFWLFSPPVVS